MSGLIKTKRSISVERRAQIGQEKRARTRADILRTAFDLMGRPEGHLTSVEEVYRESHVSRGTFYNYFSSLDELFDALRFEITHDLNDNVRSIIGQMKPGAERTMAAIRYYLSRTAEDPVWGWAMVHLNVSGPLFGKSSLEHTGRSIEEGIRVGEFQCPSPAVGRDLVVGTLFASMITILNGSEQPDYRELVVRQIMTGLGTPKELIDRYIVMALPDPSGKSHPIGE